LSHEVSAYYSSAADDQISEWWRGFSKLNFADPSEAHTENIRAFSRFFFHPRVLRAVSQCDPSTTILGCRSSLPIFVSSAALAKLGHPLGEINITRGAGRTGVIQIVSTNASFSASEIAAARVSPDQTLFFQLYKKRDDSEAEKLVREVEALGYRAIFLTVDAIIAGRRDRDIKAPFVLEDQEKDTAGHQPSAGGPQAEEEEGDTLGTAGALVAANDVDMTWEKVGFCSIKNYPED
jgi:L-lactate dehydrogenase (cytochrome)